MGMYTEFHFNVEFKEDVPEEVVKILKLMTGEVVFVDTPKHRLFKSPRWTYMLTMDSYYFPAETHSKLKYDDTDKTYYLCIRCNLKNYNNEISNFLDWIYPYVTYNGKEMCGFYRYEEEIYPTVLIIGDGGIRECRVSALIDKLMDWSKWYTKWNSSVSPYDEENPNVEDTKKELNKWLE